MHSCLRSAPDFTGFQGTGAIEDEGQFLQTVMLTGRDHGGPGRFAFDPAAHLTESSPRATSEAAGKLLAQWTPYWQTDRTWWIEKSPPNLIRARYLQHLFPDARFVMIMRHPVTTSLATRKFSPQRLHSLLAHWFRAHGIMHADLPFLRHVKVVRYEDLCGDSDNFLANLAGFLGVDDRFARPVINPEANAKYVMRWREMLSSPIRGPYVRLLALRYSHQSRAFGYRITEP